MLTPNTTQFIKKSLDSLPSSLSKPLHEGKVSRLVDDITTVYKLTPKQSAVLENNISLVFLGIIALSDLQKKVLMDLELPEETTLDILDIVAANLIKDDVLLALLSIEKAISGNKAGAADINIEIAEAEAALETLSPIRTMAGDSRHTPAPTESTYSSMQSAILGEGK